jgi:hypothetical protein
MKSLLTTLLIAGGVIWAAFGLMNSPLTYTVDRQLPSRVSLEAIQSPEGVAPNNLPTVIAGRVLDVEVVPGRSLSEGVLLKGEQSMIYYAPFDGSITAIPRGIRYESPELFGSIELIHGNVLAAPGPIQSRMSLAAGQSVQAIRLDSNGQPIPLERPLLEALQTGVAP